MHRQALKLAILLSASAFATAGSALAQGSIGGPTKKISIGGVPTKPASPLVPAGKVGTITIPQHAQTACSGPSCLRGTAGVSAGLHKNERNPAEGSPLRVRRPTPSFSRSEAGSLRSER